MYPKLFNLHDNPYSVAKAMKNEEDQNVETKETNMIGEREREDEEEEEKKINTFFRLIKSYQEARKRRREELGEDARKKTNVGETSRAVVPAFQPEDFSQCSADLKPLMAVSDHKEGDIKVKEEEEEAKKEEEEEEKGLDLNLAL